jgi:cytochrome c oxidase subunit 1
MFVIGGLSGIYLGSVPIDIAASDTYFVVAHIHYVLFGGSVFTIFAGVYYWFPKMFGRRLDETWGKAHFVLTFILTNTTFFGMHLMGLAGMPRRIADPYVYESLRALQPANAHVSVSAYALGFAQVIFLVNFFYSLKWGRKVEGNPWLANTLEWTDAPSPPPHGNFGPALPVVHRPPYEYALPDAAGNRLPQSAQ